MKPVNRRLFIKERQKVDREARTSGAIIAPVMYEVTGDRDFDVPFIGQVFARSDFDDQREERWVADVGEYVVLSLFNLGYRFMLAGHPVFCTRNTSVAGTMDPETFALKPAPHCVLVKPNLERAKKLVTGSSLVLLSDSVVEADDMRDGIKCEWGEVVDVGEGQWIDEKYVRPKCRKGDMILFDASHSTVPVSLRGQQYTLVSWLQVVGMSEPEGEVAWVERKRREWDQQKEADRETTPGTALIS